jgi:hypothetical protein
LDIGNISLIYAAVELDSEVLVKQLEKSPPEVCRDELQNILTFEYATRLAIKNHKPKATAALLEIFIKSQGTLSVFWKFCRKVYRCALDYEDDDTAKTIRDKVFLPEMKWLMELAVDPSHSQYKRQSFADDHAEIMKLVQLIQ